ncbi:MAG: hypothetical protein ACREBD_29095 [Blastocatellia bacterium]
MKNYSGYRVIGYLVAFLIGVLCSRSIDWFSAGVMRPPNPLKKPIPIEIANISQQDRWILGYQLFAVYLEEIAGQREYVLLIIKPKGEINMSELPDQPARFVISGLADGESILVFALNPMEIKRHPGVQLTKLLDFTADVFGRKRARLTENLKLASDY